MRAHNFIDITGQRFGRLNITSYSHTAKKFAWFNYICDCGRAGKTTGNRLRTGMTKSCGCALIEARKKSRLTHGMRHSAEYGIWCGMIGRCSNPKEKYYGRYGGRGIIVCERWLKFENFFKDMGKRPSSEYSLERIDNNGNYEPSNCKWATRKEQARNRDSNRIMSLNGVSKCLAFWAEHLGINQRTITTRLSRGWSDEKALTTPALVKSQDWRVKPCHTSYRQSHKSSAQK